MDTGLYSSLQRCSSSQWSKSGGLTRLRLVSSQQILSSVMTNIVVDWSTDHAKTPSICLLPQYSPHVRWSGFRNPGNFCLWNPEYWALESRIQLLESRIPLKRGNPESACWKSISNHINGFHPHPCNHCTVQFTHVVNRCSNLESVYITEAFKSHRICLEHQYGRYLIVLEQNTSK